MPAAIAAGLLIGAGNPTAFAQGKAEDKKEEAKKLFAQANDKLSACDFGGAYEAFKKADSLVPGAVPKFKMAESLDQKGDTKGAIKAYEAFLKSNPPKDKNQERIDTANARIKALKALPADALKPEVAEKYSAGECHDKAGRPTEAIAAYEAFLAGNPDKVKSKDRVDTATKRIGELKSAPADVKVILAPAEAATAVVSVDGAPQTGSTVKVPPGKHLISAKAEGFEEAKVEVDVKAGEKKEVTLTLVPAAAVAVPPDTGPKKPEGPKPPETPPEEPSGGSSIVPAIVTLSLAGTGAVVGTVFGILALGSKSDFEETPTQDLFDETERNALIADMSFGVALTFGVTGLVLLLTSGDDEEAPAATTPEKASRMNTTPKASVAPFGGANGGGAVGTITF
jgi:hypothetical protein